VRKYVFSLLLLLAATAVMGQKKSIVTLIKSQSSTGIKVNGKDVVKVYQGTFLQDYSTLSSDSAYFYPALNAFDAFGHVVINQGDTLHIYADLLNYNGNTKVAILTNNVRMVDKDAVLTTNHLNYNTATRIGTYTEGGKLVNKDNTLLSKNGYYFAFSRDSYFRYNVSLTTPDALVITDTMRYNTGTKISYFYGPTDIYSVPKKGEKDTARDTLYTENGDYNTNTEQAAFGKHNLYHSGTKSLKGDSLFYDKLKGYGRAVKHVTFIDKEQKVTINGNLGTYFKSDEHTVMTEDPYIIMVTEKNDSTKTDSSAKADSVAKADSILKKKPAQSKNLISMAQLIKKTLPKTIDTTAASSKSMRAKTDSLTKLVQSNINQATAGNLIKLAQNKNILSKADSLLKLPPGTITAANADSLLKLVQNKFGKARVDSLLKLPPGTITKAKVDSLLKLPQNSTTKTKAAPAKKPGKNVKGAPKSGHENKPGLPAKTVPVKDTSKVKVDSVYMSADTIETQILTYKDLKKYQEKQRLAHLRDSTGAKNKKPVVESKFLTAVSLKIQPDTSYRQRNYFGKPKPPKKKAVKLPSKKQLELDSLEKKRVADSIVTARLAEPNDTARIRIIIAHHNYKMYKSDLQAKSDSMFYASSDSTIRCFVNPMMWSQGSQLTGDTIYLQMKHKKLDNMKMFPHAFIVNIEKTDSLHFNQVSGRRMRGFFKDDKLRRMYVEGNAESIYFSRDSGKMTISGMQRSLSSTIVVDFKNNEVTNLGFYTKPENRYAPLNKFKEDEKILKGFIWKPKERPVSKESIIPSYHKKKETVKPPPGKPGAVKPPNKKPTGAKGKQVTAPPGKLPALKTAKDSVLKRDTAKIKTDTTKMPALKTGKDTAIVKPPIAKTPDGAGKVE
jgi:lipopolysaccharide export system protein LptA